MPNLVLVGLIAILLWALVSHRFERWGVAGPIGLLLLGAVTVVWDVDAFSTAIDSPISEKIVEVILAILLFADATEVKGGIFGREGKVIARLVLIALPLSIVLTVLAGVLLIPDASVLVLLVVACVILPIDFAPAASLLRNRRVPARLRQILNVESGYNDGLVSPVFGMSLALAVIWSTIVNTPASDLTEDKLDGPMAQFFAAFVNAVPATVIAVVIGIVLGAGIGHLVRIVRARSIADALGARYVMLILPLIAYGVASIPVFSANGFVAAFVAGIGYRLTRTRGHRSDGIDHSELLLVEEVGVLAANFIWFVLGGAMLVVVTSGIDWWMLLLAVLALTLLRIVPVYLSLVRSSVGRGDRLLIGALGPRGTASIVFGLLAYNALPEDDGVIVLTIMVATVVGSILLHGLAAPLLLNRRRLEEETA
ncbi:cation:proton antiporter domain-containing protein [Microbacterium murale]|uniref:NhaP-type Na+/H+ or K+/H+ antiporter n=1 Tax=Microbacterium murale TaxID=1081040 RepID=A0ABU0P4V9_9MICO|nr:cation:proton antiporter [Microbacterium murale]MDQ0642364.1 NhaP-type Na+/H+ or K+/H+ antiporter [Microbacterium murale]